VVGVGCLVFCWVVVYDYWDVELVDELFEVEWFGLF